ncbi:MAG: hypothetical protein QT02_C0002G0004 [archaeon GW2011_AR9]|nr:MAG: hypothetical protein QT02_C0002G0004 [archaeon GW2011_AR9]MBS3120531.1 hypothetical protein [Candidatus Woesearchaeota archaeon]HIG93970.1 hypothetical protein [Candidatus Woesearchaeota archaeon]HIH12183.1 hypothetical protein [Candidatus Woesearchaeota archaeon]
MSLTKLIRTAIVGAGISLSSYYALNCGGEETTNNYYGGSEEGKQNSYVDENGNYSCESGVRMTQELCLDLVDETMKRQMLKPKTMEECLEIETGEEEPKPGRTLNGLFGCIYNVCASQLESVTENLRKCEAEYSP